MDSTHFSDKRYFYRQGLTLMGRCSQLSEAWLPAAGTPLDRVGPDIKIAKP